MKNPMINDKEREALGKIFEGVKEVLKVHDPNLISGIKFSEITEAEMVHMLLYSVMFKELVTHIESLKLIIEGSEEEFIKAVTNDGEITLKEAENNLFRNIMVDLLFNS